MTVYKNNDIELRNNLSLSSFRDKMEKNRREKISGLNYATSD